MNWKIGSSWLLVNDRYYLHSTHTLSALICMIRITMFYMTIRPLCEGIVSPVDFPQTMEKNILSLPLQTVVYNVVLGT